MNWNNGGEIVYNRFIDRMIGGVAFFGETVQRNEKREDLTQKLKYHFSRAVLASVIYPYVGLCNLTGFEGETITL